MIYTPREYFRTGHGSENPYKKYIILSLSVSRRGHEGERPLYTCVAVILLLRTGARLSRNVLNH